MWDMGRGQVSLSRNSKAVADGIRAYDEAAAALERRMPVSAQELDEHHRLHQAPTRPHTHPRKHAPRAPRHASRPASNPTDTGPPASPSLPCAPPSSDPPLLLPSLSPSRLALLLFPLPTSSDPGPVPPPHSTARSTEYHSSRTIRGEDPSECSRQGGAGVTDKVSTLYYSGQGKALAVVKVSVICSGSEMDRFIEQVTPARSRERETKRDEGTDGD